MMLPWAGQQSSLRDMLIVNVIRVLDLYRQCCGDISDYGTYLDIYVRFCNSERTSSGDCGNSVEVISHPKHTSSDLALERACIFVHPGERSVESEVGALPQSDA